MGFLGRRMDLLEKPKVTNAKGKVTEEWLSPVGYFGRCEQCGKKFKWNGNKHCRFCHSFCCGDCFEVREPKKHLTQTLPEVELCKYDEDAPHIRLKCLEKRFERDPVFAQARGDKITFAEVQGAMNRLLPEDHSSETMNDTEDAAIFELDTYRKGDTILQEAGHMVAGIDRLNTIMGTELPVRYAGAITESSTPSPRHSSLSSGQQPSFGGLSSQGNTESLSDQQRRSPPLLTDDDVEDCIAQAELDELNELSSRSQGKTETLSDQQQSSPSRSPLLLPDGDMEDFIRAHGLDELSELLLSAGGCDSSSHSGEVKEIVNSVSNPETDTATFLKKFEQHDRLKVVYKVIFRLASCYSTSEASEKDFRAVHALIDKACPGRTFRELEDLRKKNGGRKDYQSFLRDLYRQAKRELRNV